MLAMMMSVVGWGQTDKLLDATQLWNYSDFIVGQNYNITYQNKTITANQWDFICLPFDASQTVLDATFGAGNYQLQQYDSMDGNTFVYKIMETPSITAGYPYLIKVTESVSDPVFTNVTMSVTSGSYYGNEDVKLYGCLITMAGWDLINNHHAYKMINGTLEKMYYDGGVFESGLFPPSAYVETYGTAVPLLSIEGGSGSGSSGDDPDDPSGGDDPVDPSSLAYKIANQQQLTNAPTIYIDLPDKGDTSLDDFLYKQGGEGQRYDDAPYRRASIKVVATDDTTSPHYMESFEVDADHLEIKVRGNSTSMSQYTGHGGSDAKRPYRLKFAKKDKTLGIDFKHDMINGGYSKRNWTLLANAFDHSLIRNALTCELGKIVGMPFNPGYKFVDLVINGNYRGTYQVSDHCEVDGDRINIDEDTGWYVEFQGRTDMADFPMYNSSGGLTYNISNPEPAYTGTETNRVDSAAVESIIKDEMADWFSNKWQPAFNAGFTSPTTGWRAYNDEETLMKFWIITEITGDYDGLMSVKAYRETDGKLHWGPVWDKDLAYGNYSSMSNPEGRLVKDMENASSVKGYFVNNFAKDPAFMAKVKAKMDELVAGGLKTILCDKIDELAALVAETEALNAAKWTYKGPGCGLEEYDSDVSGYDNHAAYVAQLKDWINKRVDYVQTQINTLYEETNTATAFEYDVAATSSDNITAKLDKLVDVTMTNRTFTTGVWNTISLPFSATETQLKSVFGNDYELKEFSGVDENDNTKLLFTTPADNSIQAGVPYLIKPSQAVAARPVFSGVTITANAKGWKDNFYYGGEAISFGNYEFISHLVVDYAAGRKAINSDATLEDTGSWSDRAVGSQAFIRILNSAEVPTITFPSGETSAVRTQLTNLPTVYIDTQDGAEIQSSAGDYVAAAIEVIDNSENPILESFTETSEFLEIRGRGKTEWDVADGKKSYRLKFAKKHKYDLTGAGYTKRNWVLAACAADESMIKNALTKPLGDALDLPFTPSVCFVDLVVNNEYMGTYSAMDFVEADREDGVSKRVDADEKTGWLIELMNKDGVDTSGDVYLAGTDYTSPWVVIKNPEPDYKKTDTQDVIDAAIEAVKTPVQTFISSLWSNPETYVDVASLVNWYIASEVLGGTATLSSVYAYKDADDTRLKFGPLWGNELSWQNATMDDLENDATKNGLVVNSATESAVRNLLKSLWNESWFQTAVLSRWNEVKTGLVTTLQSEAAALETTIATSWAKNFAAKADDGAGWTATGTLSDDVDAIENYIDERIAYLDRKFALMATLLEYDVKCSNPQTTYAAFDGSQVSIVLKNRGTLWGGEWNMLCLPFELTTDQVHSALGEGVDVRTLSSVTVTDASHLSFNFNTAETPLVAGQPYLVKPTADVSTPTFAGVTFDADVEAKEVEIDGGYKMVGTLSPTTLTSDGTQLYLGRANKLYKPSRAVEIDGCRAYIVIPASAAKMSIMFDTALGEATGIRQADAEVAGRRSVYNLNGQKMDSKGTGEWPKGVYIVNGRKIVR